MKHLPFVAFAAGAAIWGLASIQDRSVQKSLSTNGVEAALARGHGQTIHRAFEAATPELAASTLLMAGLTLDQQSPERAQQADAAESASKGR